MSTPWAAWRRRALGGARTRILAAVLALLVLSTALSTFTLRQILLARTDERVDRALHTQVEEFRRLAATGRDDRTGQPLGSDVEALFDAFLARDVPHRGQAAFTFAGSEPHRTNAGSDTGDAVIARVRSLGDVPGVARGEVPTPAGLVRYVAVPVRMEGRRRGTFVVTANLGVERAEVADAVRVAALVSVAVLGLAAVLAFLAAGRVLAPLRELSDTARAIGESDLTRRIDVRGHDEIAELGHTFNAMLDRLESGFASQRAFLTDAGHELRTPITIVRGHLELLGDSPQERRETVDLVTDELDRMTRFVDDLLTLAKAERGDFLHLEDVDLDVLTEELMAKATGLAPRDWRLRHTGVGRLTADRQRLTQAVMNLAANAAQHTSEGSVIELGSALANGHARVWVRDEGPGIEHGEVERIFERFARGGDGRRHSDGAGLGLAIVKAIAVAHGGRVDLDTAPGTGSKFTIVIPANAGEVHAR